MSRATNGVSAGPAPPVSRFLLESCRSDASLVRTDGFHPVRRAMNASKTSRPAWTIEINPPGQ